MLSRAPWDGRLVIAVIVQRLQTQCKSMWVCLQYSLAGACIIMEDTVVDEQNLQCSCIVADHNNAMTKTCCDCERSCILEAAPTIVTRRLDVMVF